VEGRAGVVHKIIDGSMSSIEKFTIIIPTHNRPDYLRRVLDYYSSYKAGYNIIVADSSSDENKRRNKETISSLPDLKILYFGHYPSESNMGINLPMRWIMSKQNIVCFVPMMILSFRMA
jgi:glycosyltransferase involved in cell wall biosynthesis